MEKSWFAKLHFPWEKTELCIYLHDNWFCFPYLGDLFTLICILLSVRVVPSSGFITSIINCKLLSYLVVNLVDYTKSSFLFSDYDNNGQRYIYKVNKKHFPIFFKEPILYIIVMILLKDFYSKMRTLYIFWCMLRVLVLSQLYKETKKLLKSRTCVFSCFV